MDDARPLPQTDDERFVAERNRTSAERTRQSRAQSEAGMGIPIDEVIGWTEAWDTPNELPMPKARRTR